MSAAGEPTRIIAATDIRSKKNLSGVDIAKNTVVKLDSTFDLIVLPTAITDHLYGVTQEIIKNGCYGQVQLRGRTVCRAHAALATPGVLLMAVANTGRVDTWNAGGAGNNAAVVGILEDTAGVQDDLVMVEMAGPGVVKQQ